MCYIIFSDIELLLSKGKYNMKSLFVKSNTLEQLVKNAAIHTSPSSLIEKTELIDTNELITPFELYRRYISGGDKIEFLAIKVRIALQLQLEKESQTKFELDEFLKESINLSPDEILEYDLSIEPIIDRIVLAKYPYIQDGFISAIFPHPLDNFYIHAENKLIPPNFLLTSCIIKYVYYIIRLDVTKLKEYLLTKHAASNHGQLWDTPKSTQLVTVVAKTPLETNPDLTLITYIVQESGTFGRAYTTTSDADAIEELSNVYYVPDLTAGGIGRLIPQELYEANYGNYPMDDTTESAPSQMPTQSVVEYLPSQSDHGIPLDPTAVQPTRPRRRRAPKTPSQKQTTPPQSKQQGVDQQAQEMNTTQQEVSG